MKMIRLFIIAVFALLGSCDKNSDKQRATEIHEQEGNVAVAEKKSGKTEIIEPLPRRIQSNKDDAEMILIPAGSFIYGINKTMRDSILKVLSNAQFSIFELEFPEQRKLVPSYYIDKLEVTNKQYAKFMKETGYSREPRYWLNRLYNQSDHPVVGVTWVDAEAYAKWTGKRLPTEEEWEKAARGVDGRIWPWGNEPSGKKYNGRSAGKLTPVDVGSYPEGASPYGVMDMAGNVFEMTTGFWGETGRAIRGGSYLNAGAYTRTMFRWATAEEEKGAEYLGFRCVMDTTMIKSNAIAIQ